MYLVTANNLWADVDDKGNAIPLKNKTQSNKVEECNTVEDCDRVTKHWESKLAEAQSKLNQLIAKKTLLKKAA